MKRILIILTIFISATCFAQDALEAEPIVIQFSGIVVTGDSAYGLPHVHIYVPRTRRGTETNDMGYFTMPALAGDSVVIKHIGFKKKYIILPDGMEKQSYTYIIDLKQDTTELAEVTVMPFPTFQIFKHAFAKADIPKDENEKNWEKNMRKEDMEKMMLAMQPSGYESYRTYTLSEIQRIEKSNITNTNPLLNLFAWVSLIQELSDKAKKRKKQKEKDAYESDF